MPAESSSPLPNASTKEKTRVHVAKGDKAARQDADQDTYPIIGEEAPPKTLAEDKDKAVRQDAD
jgi:hypothetical protein